MAGKKKEVGKVREMGWGGGGTEKEKCKQKGREKETSRHEYRYYKSEKRVNSERDTEKRHKGDRKETDRAQ